MSAPVDPALVSQIRAACTSFLSPSSDPATRQEAHSFLNQVKDARLSQGTWQVCWAIWLDRSGPEQGQERIFAAQVVGEAIPELPPETLQGLWTELLAYYSSEFGTGPAEAGAAYLKNAAAHLGNLLFRAQYPTLPFFSALFALPASRGSTDLTLRVLLALSTDLSDTLLKYAKPHDDTVKDTVLRDAVRQSGDAVLIARWLWDVVAPPPGKQGVASEESEQALKNLASWVGWIDINAVVSGTTIPVLQRSLRSSSASERSAALELYTETLSKGMPTAGEKLNLLAFLEISKTLGELLDGATGLGDAEAVEKIAHALAVGGLEGVRIADDSSASPTEHAAAGELLTSLQPLVLRCLQQDSPAIAAALPLATAMLSSLKKERKRLSAAANGATQDLPKEREQFLESLLEVAVKGLEYTSEDEWEAVPGEGEEEEQVAFAARRKGLALVINAIASLVKPTYMRTISGVVLSTCATYSSSPEQVTWQRAELALHLLYSFGLAIGAPNGVPAFVDVPAAELQKQRQNAAYSIPYSTFPLSPLGEMLLQCTRTGLGKSSMRPAATWMEVCVRYAEWWPLVREEIGGVLEGFLGDKGLHQTDDQARMRSFYLFSRFIAAAKALLQASISGAEVANILSQLQDLMPIRAELPDQESPGEDILLKATTGGVATLFNSQLYLYEATGTLIGILNQVPDQQVALLRSALTPLLADLAASARTQITSVADVKAVLQAHHLIMAIGNIAKGFPDLSARQAAPTGSWVEVMAEATGQIVEFARGMGAFVIIRDATRFAFNRIVATTGSAVLHLIPALIETLVVQVTYTEMGDVLAFLGLLMAKFKANIFDILDSLFVPVLQRVFFFLEQPINGTDDKIQHSTLLRAYFTFLGAVMSCSLQATFYSPRNMPHLSSLLDSLTHYLSSADATPPEQKLGFSLICRLAGLWVEPVTGATEPSPVPGFEKYLYDKVLNVAFATVMARSWNFQDAQSQFVIAELGNIFRLLHTKRGEEFDQGMRGFLASSFSCPDEVGRELVAAIEQANDSNQKQYRKFISDWLSRLRDTQLPQQPPSQ